MTPLTMIGCKVEQTTDGYRVTDHVGNVHVTYMLNDGPTCGLTLVKAGKFPGFSRKDRVVVRNGVLCLIGR